MMFFSKKLAGRAIVKRRKVIGIGIRGPSFSRDPGDFSVGLALPRSDSVIFVVAFEPVTAGARVVVFARGGKLGKTMKRGRRLVPGARWETSAKRGQLAKLSLAR